MNESLGTFDTVVAFGNNFGLFESAVTARRLLKRARRHDERAAPASSRRATTPPAPTTPSTSPTSGGNRQRGRMPGQIRIRVRYRTAATPWFPYLLAAPDEMAELAASGGWRVRRFLTGEGSYYVGVLRESAR